MTLFLNLIAGLDDAGRGSVIGPLVIAGVLFTSDKVDKLAGLGVKDSKLLSPSRRSKLAEEIREQAVKVEIIETSPQEVDRIVLEGKKLFKLNWLEAKVMAKIIDILQPEIVYVDASDVFPERFKKTIEEMLTVQSKIISEHNADLKWLPVSAASILAKTHRDYAVDNIKKSIGDFGSGYPSDPRTVKFLEDWMRKNREYPPFVRKSWKTVKRLNMNLSKQNRLNMNHSAHYVNL